MTEIIAENQEERGQKTLTILKRSYFYSSLPVPMHKQIEAIEKQNPRIAAAFIKGLEFAISGFESFEHESNAVAAESLRERTLRDVYLVFQIMLDSADYEQAADIIFDSPFWFNSLTNPNLSPESAKKIQHIIDANRIIADFVAKSFEKGEEISVCDLGAGGGGTIRALQKALLEKGIEAQFDGAEICQILAMHCGETFKGQTNVRINNVSSKELLEVFGEGTQVITACYSLHHAYMPLLLNTAIREGRIQVNDGMIRLDGKEIMPFSEIDPDKFNFRTPDEMDKVLVKNLANSPQYQTLVKAFESLAPNGILAIAEPGFGLSRDFNTNMVYEGVRAARGLESAIGFNGLMEVGPSCFTSLEVMMRILEQIGFRIEKRVVQFHNAENRYYTLVDEEIDAHVRDPFYNDYNLGYVLIAKKPADVDEVRSNIASSTRISFGVGV